MENCSRSAASHSVTSNPSLFTCCIQRPYAAPRSSCFLHLHVYDWTYPLFHNQEEVEQYFLWSDSYAAETCSPPKNKQKQKQSTDTHIHTQTKTKTKSTLNLCFNFKIKSFHHILDSDLVYLGWVQDTSIFHSQPDEDAGKISVFRCSIMQSWT